MVWSARNNLSALADRPIDTTPPRAPCRTARGTARRGVMEADDASSLASQLTLALVRGQPLPVQQLRACLGEECAYLGLEMILGTLHATVSHIAWPPAHAHDQQQQQGRLIQSLTSLSSCRMLQRALGGPVGRPFAVGRGRYGGGGRGGGGRAACMHRTTAAGVRCLLLLQHGMVHHYCAAAAAPPPLDHLAGRWSRNAATIAAGRCTTRAHACLFASRCLRRRRRRTRRPARPRSSWWACWWRVSHAMEAAAAAAARQR